MVQGKVGLYARIEAPTPSLLLQPYCPSVVDIFPGKKAYPTPILTRHWLTYPHASLT